MTHKKANSISAVPDQLLQSAWSFLPRAVLPPLSLWETTTTASYRLKMTGEANLNLVANCTNKLYSSCDLYFCRHFAILIAVAQWRTQDVLGEGAIIRAPHVCREASRHKNSWYMSIDSEERPFHHILSWHFGQAPKRTLYHVEATITFATFFRGRNRRSYLKLCFH